MSSKWFLVIVNITGFFSVSSVFKCVYLKYLSILLTLSVFRPSWNRDIVNALFVKVQYWFIVIYILLLKNNWKIAFKMLLKSKWHVYFSQDFSRFPFTFPLFPNINKMQCEGFLIISFISFLISFFFSSWIITVLKWNHKETTKLY